MDQRVGIAAIIAIVAAIGSFIASFTGHPVWGIVLAIVSIPAGLIGVLMAGSPKVRGGLISLLSIFLGLAALGLGILVGIGVIIF